MRARLEVAVDSIVSAVLAWKSGADRLEVCEDLSVGGVTPSVELVKEIKETVPIPVFVLIRCRPGNFNYTPPEVQKMIKQIKLMNELEVEGLVFGALDKECNVDFPVCKKLMAAVGSTPVTFHRAFDQIENKTGGMEAAIELGFRRILTAGCLETADKGIEELDGLILQSGARIIVVVGGGITDTNIESILKKIRPFEFHTSGRVVDPDSPTLKSKICSATVIRNIRLVLEHLA